MDVRVRTTESFRLAADSWQVARRQFLLVPTKRPLHARERPVRGALWQPAEQPCVAADLLVEYFPLFDERLHRLHPALLLDGSHTRNADTIRAPTLHFKHFSCLARLVSCIDVCHVLEVKDEFRNTSASEASF